MLTQIKLLFQKKKQISLLEISRLLKVSPELARDMISCYLNKGRVRCFQKTNQCGSSCQQCSSFHTEMYEWLA